MKRIEEQKCNAMAQIQIAVDQKKVAPKDAPFIVEVNRLRILDKLHAEEGIEEEDIKKSVLIHSIDKTYEY